MQQLKKEFSLSQLTLVFLKNYQLYLFVRIISILFILILKIDNQTTERFTN